MGTVELNLLPFLVEALGSNSKIYKDIDKLYKTNKYKFYKSAKEHELYNHHIIKEGSLAEEEYCKKILGIIIEAVEDEIIYNEVQDLIKKGFKYAWSYLQNNSKIDLGEFANAFTRKHKGFKDKYNNSIESYIVIVLFVALNNQLELVQGDFFNEFLGNLKERWKHYDSADRSRIALDKISKEDKETIKHLKQEIYNKFGAIRNFDDILNGQFESKNIDQSAFLFDFEDISSISIFKDIKFTNKDIEEILYLYVIANENLKENQDKGLYTIINLIDDKIVEDAARFLISKMYTKYMIKAYKEVKQTYFKNNKETMFIELEGLETSLDSMTAKFILEKHKHETLLEEYTLIEKENIRLAAELEEEKRNREELNSLREFIFNLDKEEDYIEEEPNLEELKDYKAVIVGGHEKWQQRMKELLPNFIFIHPDNLNFDTKLLDKVSIVFIYTNYLNHSIYYKVMNYISGKGTRVSYLNQQNENLILKNIYEKMKH